jgi:predicted CopG family antitoxin
MAHQISVSDEAYAALEAVATRLGRSIDDLLHQAIQCQKNELEQLQEQAYQYPTLESDTPAEEAEDAELAAAINLTKPWPSEMIIEDRGPR